MKSKEVVFYLISILSLSLFMLLPFTTGFAAGSELPGFELCHSLLESVNHYVSSKY